MNREKMERTRDIARVRSMVPWTKEVCDLADALEEAVGLLRQVDESILTPKHREYCPAIWDVHQFLRKWEEVGGE